MKARHIALAVAGVLIMIAAAWLLAYLNHVMPYPDWRSTPALLTGLLLGAGGLAMAGFAVFSMLSGRKP